MVAIVLFSTLVTTVITSVELYHDYRAGIGKIRSDFNFIKKSYLRSLDDSVWVGDKIQIQAQLNGLKNIGDIQYVAVLVDGKPKWHAGQRVSDPALARNIPLVHHYQNQNEHIGSLYIVGDVGRVLNRVWDKLISTLISNGIKTFLVAGFMLLAFQILVGRHLEAVASYVRKFQGNFTGKDDIKLDRSSTGRWRPDALDFIANALNDMRLALEHDISGREEAEQALKRSERNLYNILENLPAQVGYCDKNGRIQYANREYAESFGYTQDSIVGKSIDEVKGPQGIQYKHHIDRVLKGRPQLFQQERVLPGGEVQHLSAHYVPDLNDSQVEGFYILKYDISEQKQKQGELQIQQDHLERVVAERTHALIEAKKEAEAANAAKGAFLANMSHELRTPLQSVVGAAHLIRQAGVTPTQSDLLDKHDGAANHLLSVINSILDLSKIEANKLTLEEQRIDVPELVNEVSDLLQARAQEKGLQLVVYVEPMPEALVGDATRIKQALLNYGSNAVKYTNSGQVTLRAFVVEDEAQSALVRYEVTDTGIGIEPAAIQRLFSAFEQVDKSTTRNYGGTGLGLALTRELAKLMNGDAGVESTPGLGSTFWFTARLRKDEQKSRVQSVKNTENPKALLATQHAGKRILLVEDEPTNQRLFEAIINGTGLDTVIAGDGVEALSRVKQESFDLILMDVQMPKMDGLETTQEIRKLPDLQSIPVIAMTGNAFAEDQERCLQAGMNDFLSKPVKPVDLYSKILEWLPTDATETDY